MQMHMVILNMFGALKLSCSRLAAHVQAAHSHLLCRLLRAQGTAQCVCLADFSAGEGYCPFLAAALRARTINSDICTGARGISCVSKPNKLCNAHSATSCNLHHNDCVLLQHSQAAGKLLLPAAAAVAPLRCSCCCCCCCCC